MSPAALYFIPLAVVVASWFAFILIFVRGRPKAMGGATKRRDRASLVGIALVMLGFAVVWSFYRRPPAPLFPMAAWAQAILGLFACVLAITSVGFMWAAVRTLGKQWSYRARTLDDHALITTGPYGVVRHPIYSGLIGLTIAVGIAYSHWIGLIVGLTLAVVGTIIRVRGEERLLREQFPQAYEDYARRVPGIVPMPFGRG